MLWIPKTTIAKLLHTQSAPTLTSNTAGSLSNSMAEVMLSYSLFILSISLSYFPTLVLIFRVFTM